MTSEERAELATELREAATQVMKTRGALEYWAELMRTAASALEVESAERAAAIRRLDNAMASIKPLIDHLVDL